MTKIFRFLFAFLIFCLLPQGVFAQSPSFVSVVNPVRGNDFWDLKTQSPEVSVKAEEEILRKNNISATWLIRFDALDDKNITSLISSFQQDEKGLFLEITPTLTKEAGVKYNDSGNWHSAGSAFLSGYERGDRIKLVDKSFEKFKTVFGFYPKSVGAWWIDSYSLEYMQKKYGITGSLMVSDQYTTDNYQIWGQYWSTPFYPAKTDVLHPAQTKDSKLPVVIMQWAPRDPLNGYGNGVEESTFSVQANDYLDYHSLDSGYFSKLIDLYTKQTLNQFNHVVVGLENSYSWEKYGQEYEKQIKLLSEKQSIGQFKVITMGDFASWYSDSFPNLSPPQIIVANDPLGSEKKVVWFMNPYYRAGWFFNNSESVFRDIRQYRDGEEEPCLSVKCNEINFATSATRVLDEISFGHKLSLDPGKISDFNVKKSGDNYVLTYKNEAGNVREIDFLPRDIKIDEKVSSIDTIILDATKNAATDKGLVSLEKGAFKWSPFSIGVETIGFLIFLILGCLVPGLLVLNKILTKQIDAFQKNTLAIILGIPLVTTLFYLLSILRLRKAILLYLLISLIFLFKMRKQIFSKISINFKDGYQLLVTAVIGFGTIFQQLPVFKSGLEFPYGLGFWGPNSHDGIWHVALINELIKKGIPVENPVFSGNILKNYHYFYDLLVALTNFVVKIPVLDLVFRFYPVLFSLLLGIGSYYLVNSLTKSKKGVLFSLYLVYFAGSFGWIVEYIKQRHLGGESAFWANQSVSFNLNPPFAVSLLIVIAILQLLPYIKTGKLTTFILIILSGTLISFKAYGAILILPTFLLVGILRRNLHYIYVFAGGSVVSAILILSNFSVGEQLIIFSPFWFIHSMIDSPDRVGWARLSLMRAAGTSTGNWFKFIVSETAALIIFIVGNLGTRFLAIFTLTKLKSIFSDTFYLFLFIFSLLSLSIPIIFIQAGNPWNTIQFMYYFIYLGALVGGIILARIKFLPMVALFLIITPINSWATANGYLTNQPHAYVSSKEVKALDFLKSQEAGVVLTYPYDSKLKNKIPEPWPLLAYDDTAYVSALSGKPVFLEDEGQNQILLTDYKKRLVLSKDFFSKPLMLGVNFLENNHVKYIYLPKIYNVRVDETAGIKNIFENEEVIIYKFKN